MSLLWALTFQMPTTIVMSWLTLGEALSAIAVLGGALCLVGVAIARRVRQPASETSMAAPSET